MPRGLTRGVASGLILMAAFTMWWASDTFYGWDRAAAVVTVGVCGVAALVFVVHAVRLLRAERGHPALPSEDGRGKRPNGALFGAVFGAEGLLIGLSVALLSSNGLDRFIVPTIAIIVGLHFFPMARVFHRSIDTWLAVWTTLVGATGLILVGLAAAPVSAVWSWVGAGVAVATLSYGGYMTRLARRLLRSTHPEPPTRTADAGETARH